MTRAPAAAIRREREEYVLDKLRAMVPIAVERLEEISASPNKRAASEARKLLARHDAALRSTKEQKGARTRAAS